MSTNTSERATLIAYQLDVSGVMKDLGTSERGLSSSEVSKRLTEYGPNQLAEEAPVSRWKLLLHQFVNPLVYILLIAAAVTAFLGEYKDTVVILVAVAIRTLIGYTQELKAEGSVRALKKMSVLKARVVRDAREREVNSEDLVPGDMVLLASGVKVPADLRLIRTTELRIDEAVLTGESVAADKDPAAIAEANLTPGDQRNMAFMGTAVVSGRALGMVTATGSRTVLGNIAVEMRQIGRVETPLERKFHDFALRIGYGVLAASAALFVLGILTGESLRDMFMTTIAAAVATIPEGLPIVVTVTMAVGVARMAKRNAVIRKLAAVETLGSTTVICSDKTGTLTKNEMTVRMLHDGSNVYEVTGSGYSAEGRIESGGHVIAQEQQKRIQMLLRIGMLCNESSVYQEDGAWKIEGDPTEGALVIAAMKASLKPETERNHYPQKGIIPFESDRGYMATLHEHAGKRYVFIKGGPERVVDLCPACGDKAGTLDAAHQFAKEGMRVLAMAYKEVPADGSGLTHGMVEGNLTFAGLQAMIDPPRPEAIEAVAGCRRAGIRVVMITGDHAVTAQAIGARLGIGAGEDRVIIGKGLALMSDDDLFREVQRVSVYARVAPEHKLRIVKQLQRHGEIVAVTGDGVNDAPALKAAHIGIAMGRTGTDVAKEAADMVVADDNFASIFSAVREGRIVFDNLRKVTFFLLPTGVAAIASIIGSVLFGMPMPYLPSQLLWINLVTNGMQDVALAFEPGDADVLERPPRPPQEGILSSLLVQRTIIVGLLIAAGVMYEFKAVLDAGMSLDKARTVAMTTMVFFQFFQTWNSRSETRSIFRIDLLSNRLLFFAMIAAFFAQFAVVEVPALQWIFRTEPFTASEWVRVALITSTVLIVVEVDKLIRKRREHA